jgi:hypothetical protein
MRDGMGVTLATLLVTACVAGPATSGREPGGADPSPVAGSPAAPASVGWSSMEPSLAARRLLAEVAAEVGMSVSRETEPDDPVETLIAGSGLIEPAGGRGHVRYDLSGLFAAPGTSAAPDPTSLVEIVWTPDDLLLRFPNGPDDDWQHRSRSDARADGGLVGRLPDEALGLVLLVAASAPDRMVQLDPAPLGPSIAERWLVRATVEEATAAGVPADMPDAQAFRLRYGVTEVEVEVWVVDGELRRLRYALSRDEAPEGDPSRTTTTYDWRLVRDAAPIVIPEAGGN